MIFGIKDIMEIIPHRQPMLLVDKVEILEEDKKAVGFKGVTYNEPFFAGHFPTEPVMPGVLIMEAMAQTTASFFCIEMICAEKSAILVESIRRNSVRKSFREACFAWRLRC